MNKRSFDRKLFNYLLIILLFSLSGLLYFFLVMPLKEETDLLKAEYTGSFAESQLLESEMLNQEEGESERAALEEQIPSSTEIDSLLLSLKEIEAGSTSKVSSITFNSYNSELPAGKPESLNGITFTVTVESPNYQQFLKFLTGLEEMKRVITVNSLTYTPSRDPGNTSILATMQLTAYYLVPTAKEDGN